MNKKIKAKNTKSKITLISIFCSYFMFGYLFALSVSWFMGFDSDLYYSVPIVIGMGIIVLLVGGISLMESKKDGVDIHASIFINTILGILAPLAIAILSTIIAPPKNIVSEKLVRVEVIKVINQPRSVVINANINGESFYIYDIRLEDGEYVKDIVYASDDGHYTRRMACKLNGECGSLVSQDLSWFRRMLLY